MLDLSSGMPIYNLDGTSDSHNYHQSNDFSPEQRPSWLFSNPIHPQYHSTSSPTEALSSLLDPFAASPTADPSLNITHLTGVPYRQMNGVAVNRYANSPMARRQFEPPTSLTPFGSPLTPNPNPLNASSMSLPISSPTNGSANVPAPKNPKLYKTELCRSWMDHGRCNYGERCQYAHGEQEKRPIPRHPKYKTEACLSFHQTGLCPYGPRCHFIHNETELLANMPASSPIGSTISTPLSNSMSSKPTPVPNNVALVQRMCSLPGYASTGDSAGSSSSADSGSESPNGSFSPGLELDENGE
ncbi:hypothetical protein WR25_13958 isoform B [Diploscapter pachys]|uniref:C3H1-type domain-containing protein n=1 Tax=Diploscapter pachys TaxID=2018661 RepID=A0A2A2JF17_9BILA|nr:hypothetical protein WR25_13958 isoform B [Diploscapter pachys]